jgi:hypothetical protein
MAKMGRYCKAYPLEAFREYPKWTEAPIEPDPVDADADAGEEGANEEIGTYYFLQEDYVVTGGIFQDESVVFSDVTPEWIEFCTGKLEFKVPEYLLEDPIVPEPEPAAPAGEPAAAS